ncbi:MAG: pseudouridylate synthase [Muribaculaceae bacterium]|nr:pseudouridylate synthase [Muribaculaceae bacterium]
MNEPIANLYDIIPQRPPMVMIDSLVLCDSDATVTLFTIPTDCILVDDNCLTAEGMLENIAQTCAARIGYLNLQAGATVKLGFIGAVKDFTVSERPTTGSLIRTVVTVREEIFGITLVDADIYLENRLIANTTMKIALSDIDAAK